MAFNCPPYQDHPSLGARHRALDQEQMALGANPDYLKVLH